jgi:hypothetical protein
MRRLLVLGLLVIGALPARAVDRVNWEITPRVAAPGQPFRLQIQVESDVVLGGANQAGRDIKPPRGMALRLSGQVFRADSNEATLNFSGVAPDRPGEYVIPGFDLRFATKVIPVPEIRLIVSDQASYRRDAYARAELVLPDRTFYVGELVRGSIRMRSGEEEEVMAAFGLESAAEGFSLNVTAERQALGEGRDQGLQTTFDLTPLRAGVSDITLNGIMLLQAGGPDQGGRDRPFAFRRRLTVEHVPARGRPADWNGAIGRFVAESLQVSKDTPEVGEPIRLRATLTGEGNFDRILPPEIKGDETWDVLPGAERRRQAETRRTFSYTLVPRLPGKLRTPAIGFSVFDPATKTFSRVSFAPLEITATGSGPARVDLVSADPAAPAAALRPTLTNLADPQPRRADPLVRTLAVGELTRSTAFWAGNGLLLAAVIAATVVAAVVATLAANPGLRRRRRARALLRAALIEAGSARRQEDAVRFAQTVVRGLQAAAAAHLDAAEDAMTQSDIERAFPGVDRALLDQLFARAYAERFATLPAEAGLERADEAVGLLRRTLALL